MCVGAVTSRGYKTPFFPPFFWSSRGWVIDAFRFFFGVVKVYTQGAVSTVLFRIFLLHETGDVSHAMYLAPFKAACQHVFGDAFF